MNNEPGAERHIDAPVALIGETMTGRFVGWLGALAGRPGTLAEGGTL